MTWADFAVILLLLLSAILAMMRGFVREALGIAAWAGAGAFTLYAAPILRPTIADMIGDPDFVNPVTYAVLFLAALIVFLIVSNVLSGWVHASPLGGLNRLLGFAFGAARGAAVVMVVYVLANRIVPPQYWPASVRQAQSLPLVERGAKWALVALPERYRPDLDAERQLGLPVAGPRPTAEQAK